MNVLVMTAEPSLRATYKSAPSDGWAVGQEHFAIVTVGLGNLQSAPTLRLIRQKEQICNLLVVRAQQSLQAHS